MQYLTARSVTPSPKAWIMAFQSVAPGCTLPWLMATRSRTRSSSGVQAKGILLIVETKVWKKTVMCFGVSGEWLEERLVKR